MATATAETSRNAAKAATGPHGAAELPSVVVTSYNLEIQILAEHNDAVIQGLSEMPAMQDVENWAVLTIGTGLGNASYRNRAKPGSTGRD